MSVLSRSTRRRLKRFVQGLNLEAAANQRVRLPAFDTFSTQPGFSIHDTVVTDRGMSSSYGWLWQHLKETNPYLATVIEAMRDMITAQGYDLTKTTPQERLRWVAWKRKVRFGTKLSEFLEELFTSGSACWVMVRQTNEVMDLELQLLSSRGLFVVWNDDHSDWIGFNYRQPNSSSHFDPTFGRATFIAREDLVFCAINVPPGQVLGRALNYQAFNEYISLKDMLRVLGVMAQRQTSRFIHWTVDLEGLSDQPDEEDTDEDERKDSPAVQHMKAIRDVVEDRVTIDTETGATEVVDNVITSNRVKGVDLTGDTNIAGVVEGINEFKNAVDRKARIPPVFLGTPDSSNRATSYNEVLMLVLMLKAYWNTCDVEFEAKILPELRLSGEFVPEEEVIQEDEAVKGEMIKALLDMFDRGLIQSNEVRQQVTRLLTIDLADLVEEGGGDQEAVDLDDPAEPEEAPASAG